jgi:hypothetical protein
VDLAGRTEALAMRVIRLVLARVLIRIARAALWAGEEVCPLRH